MSNILYRSNESFFVDIGVLLTTDLYVVDKIYSYLFRTNDESDPFYPLKLTVECTGIGYDNIGKLVQTKSSINPLVEYMNDQDFTIANNTYNGILYDNDVDSDVYFPKLSKTNIGNMIDVMAKDDNVGEIFVATRTLPTAMFEYILALFQGVSRTKIKFVVGNISNFLQDNQCSNYFIEDIMRIKDIATKRHLIESNIYVMEYGFNMNPEIPNKINSPIPVEDLNNKYNLKIHSIGLPFF